MEIQYPHLTKNSKHLEPFPGADFVVSQRLRDGDSTLMLDAPIYGSTVGKTHLIQGEK